MCRHAASGDEVRWWEASKRLTFSAAARAALGDVLSTKDMDELFPLACEAGSGIYRLVRPACMCRRLEDTYVLPLSLPFRV